MDDEIELKLLVSPDAGKELKTGFIDKLESAYSYSSSNLYNSYFDTPDKKLQGWGMACRVRGKDGLFEQTIKTSGSGTGGLAARPEYNVAIEGNEPDLSLFTALQWPQEASLPQVQDELVCLFDTHFDRESYLLTLDADTEIECVFDAGLIETNRHHEPICEIELELKKGEPIRLVQLGKQLLDVIPFRLGAQSKAQRGYRLVDGVRLSRQKISEVIPRHEKGSLEDVLLAALGDALSHWQHCEQYYLEEHKLRELYGISDTLNFLQFVLTTFAQSLACEELKLLAGRIESVRKDWEWAEEIDSLRELRSSKGAFRKKLACNDQLMKKLKVAQQDILQRCSPEQLFLDKAYVGVQLDILQMMVEKPWRKQGSAYQSSLPKVATQWIERLHARIQQTLQSHQTVSIVEFLDSKSFLKEMEFLHILLNDSIFQSANLSDVNWRNILDGIIDLTTLQVLEVHLKLFEMEDRESLLEWCRKKQSYTLELMDEGQHHF